MNIEPNAEHPGLLAGAPGFHGLARTALVGLDGPGSAVLDVWCSCDESVPVAKITLRLRPKNTGDFPFTELGRGEIAVRDALDLRTHHGHFITERVWYASPDGWMQIGELATTAQRRSLKSASKSSEGAIVPERAVAAAAPPEISADDLCAECQHPRGEHDPCAECARKKKARRICRSFVEPKPAKKR